MHSFSKLYSNAFSMLINIVASSLSCFNLSQLTWVTDNVHNTLYAKYKLSHVLSWSRYFDKCLKAYMLNDPCKPPLLFLRRCSLLRDPNLQSRLRTQRWCFFSAESNFEQKNLAHLLDFLRWLMTPTCRCYLVLPQEFHTGGCLQISLV